MAFVESQGWSNHATFIDEGKSSETLKRPAMIELRKRIARGGVGQLVVTKLDRLSRGLEHLGQLLDEFADAEVVFAVVEFPEFKTTASVRPMSNIIGAASEFLLGLAKERLADARAAIKRQVKRVAGRVPFGDRPDSNMKALMSYDCQAVVVRDFFKLASDGATPSEIATLANLQRWANHNGEAERWTAWQLMRILTNPIYTGRIHDGASTLPGEHASIVDTQTFDEVQRQIQSRKTRVSETGERNSKSFPKPLLRGILIRGGCGRAMSTSTSQRGSIRYPYYRCRSTAGGKPPCVGVNIQCHELERFICGTLSDPQPADGPEVHALAETWSKLDDETHRELLPQILSRVVFQMADGELNLDLIDNAEEVIRTMLPDHDSP